MNFGIISRPSDNPGWMIDRTARGGLIACVVLCAATSVLPVHAAQPGWNLERLVAALAARPEGSARYTEIRTMKILTAPVRSSGVLRYRQPDTLEKQMVSPRAELMRVEGDRVMIDDGTSAAPRVVFLAEHPEAGVLIESIRAPLTGNLQKLNALFQASLGGSERRWLLSLVPRSPRAAELVRVVYVRGSGDRVTGIEIEERNGDRSVLHIEALP